MPQKKSPSPTSTKPLGKPPREPKTKVVQTNARIIIKQEEGSWAVASVNLEFGPNFEQGVCLGWVSDVTSEASSFIALRDQNDQEVLRSRLHPSIIQEAREVLFDKEEAPILTRFERISRGE